MSDSEIFKNYIKVANVFKNSRDFEDLEFLMRLYYFADVLDFSNDNNFFHYLRITAEGIIRKISLNDEQYKMLSDEVNRWKNSYDPNNKDYYYEKKKEFLSLLQIFKSFSEENQKKLQNGTIRQKLEALDEYLNDNSIDEQNPFYELVAYLELLEEYVAYKPIGTLAENLNFLLNIGDVDFNITDTDGKEKIEALFWISDMLKNFKEPSIFDENENKEEKILDSIKKSYENGDLDVKDIELYSKLSDIIIEQHRKAQAIRLWRYSRKIIKISRKN